MDSCDTNTSTLLLQTLIYIIIFVGVIVAIIGNYIQSTQLNTPGANTTSFIGNMLSIIGLFTLIPIIISIKQNCQNLNTNNIADTKKTSSLINDFLIQPGASIITIIIISYNMAINLIYKNLLINHNVSPEYYHYALLFYILLIVQLIFLFKYLSGYGNNPDDNIYKYIVYLIGTLNFMLLSIMQIILKFFSTDG